MHLIGLLAGALGVKKLTDYPQSITKLKQSLPKEEQEAFIADYKKLSRNDKTQFKEYLSQADYAAAGKMIGHDFNALSAAAKVKETAAQNEKATPVEASPLAQLDFSARINQILQTATPSIDPNLVAEAAKKYQALDLAGLSFAERHKKIMATYEKAQQDLYASVPLPDYPPCPDPADQAVPAAGFNENVRPATAFNNAAKESNEAGEIIPFEKDEAKSLLSS